MWPQNQERVRSVNVMNATYSYSMRTCARAEATRLALFTPPYKAYNQLVSFTSEANVPYMGVTTGHRTCRVSNALFVYINF